MAAIAGPDGELAGTAGVEWSATGGWTDVPAPGLVRDRLVGRLVDTAHYSVARVVAPAGFGKSRLLSHAAQLYAGPVAWCGSPDPVLRSEEAFVGWIGRGLASVPAFASLAPADCPATVDELVRAAYPEAGLPVLVVVDDVHLIEESDAEAALSDLASRAPRWMRLLLAGRVSLALDLSRLRVSGTLVEIDHDDLRFRTWEIEDLFRDVYHDPLLPEDVGALARRTGGWAAYLQLFHLATARKPQSVRRQVLSSLWSNSRLVREYLSRHLLSDLTPELKDFLVRTSVLRRPTPELCDELLGDGCASAECLDELERRHLFTERVSDGSYRYHPVLVAYLDAVLVETIGIAHTRDFHHRAAAMLERSGFAEEALAAFARSEDWVGVARVLGHSTGPATSIGDAWLEALPPTVIEADPMLLLARARRAVSSGDVAEAVRIARRAESVAASSTIAERCSEERKRLLAWASPDKVELAEGDDWSRLLRAATQKDPSAVRRRASSLPGPGGRFAEGLASLIHGDAVAASRILGGVAAHPESPAWMVAAARLAGVSASLMSGRPLDTRAIDRAREEVETAGVPWLMRLAGITLATTERGSDEVSAELLEACRREGDQWGEAMVAFASGVLGLASGTPSPGPLENAHHMFTRLGAGVYAGIAAGYQALAAHRCGDPEGAVRAATQARALGSALEAPVASATAELARGLVDGDTGAIDTARAQFESLGCWAWHAELAGIDPSLAGAGGRTKRSSAEPAVDPPTGFPGRDEGSAERVLLRCLGRFSLSVGGTPIDETAVKPMERILLHLLASRAGERVHREEIIEALWPEADPDAGRHRLQVAVSAVRRLLAWESESTLLVRDGDTYRLALPPDSDVDVWRVGHHLDRARSAHAAGDEDGEADALQSALSAYGGPLLPMDGPADWVVAGRTRLEVTLVEAAKRLAVLRSASGDHQGSAEAARRGLDIDRYRDDLWNLLIEEAERSGHPAEAGRARRSYAEVLEELGA
ncbi:MAG TPA: BTAD domain-containing putative transcriptional regulator [Acidimicrobiales bacterium]|nr:BTAD domain-containing putative transcriptional regulator [Acidimicrobiales bacterium]